MKHILLAFTLVLTISGSAQTIRGRVMGQMENEMTEPLPGATVSWIGTRSGTVTNENGEFEIGRPTNAESLLFSYSGYEADTLRYTNQSFIEVVLHPPTLGVVNVTGHTDGTKLNMRDPQRFQTITEKELCKAACCNLSESFETNASIDASITDAITGTRQIRMLGLDGRYTQIMFDNIPAVRGLASTYGLTYVPGAWINSIQIAKGVGSVLNGFESITGQINVAHKNPDNGEKLYVNAYAGSGGRLELNLLWKPTMHSNPDHESSVHLHPIFLAHGAASQLRTDMNGDGFLDNPLFSNIILRNEWHLETDGGFGGQYSINYLHIDNVSGKLDYDPKDEIRSQLWGVNMTTDRYEFTGKMGYVFPEKEWSSFGSQLNASWHEQNGNFGFREYRGEQLSARANILFASRLNENHLFTGALSYQYDDYSEQLFATDSTPVNFTSYDFSRLETVPGAAVEYTWLAGEEFILVAGARADYHNVYDLLWTPRLHARYSFTERTSLKIAAGKGYRTPSIIMDNVGMLASNRDIEIQHFNNAFPFGLEMEEAWNFGILFSQKFDLNHRDVSLSIDAFRTEFVNQLIMDIEEAQVVRFYNLDGPSYSNSVQVEFQWSPIKRLDWRLAYRWLDVQTKYASGLLEKPLLNKHRAFTNLAFETKEKDNGAHWKWDATLQWISPKRIPNAGEHTGHDILIKSESYIQLNAQITYVFRKNLELYLGGENLTNYMQHDAIISPEDPSSEDFDASLIWGPVFGRMGYVGFRWKIE